MDLTNIITLLKQENVRCWNLYIDRAKVGDIQSAKNQKQMLIALYMYIKSLEYFNGITVEEMDSIGITELQVLNCIEAAVSCTKIFKPFYYA